VPFSLQIKGSAARALEKVPKPDRQRLIEAIDRLRSAPWSGGTLKGEFGGLRRVRVGQYRIIYEVIEGRMVILVVRVAHRREAYRRLR
jgi:mRNA interferase RelE/StbE